MIAAVLLYHRVTGLEGDRYGLAVTPAEFRSHMSYLRDHCTAIPLDEVTASRRPGERRVAVTLDDGYLDNFTDASGILVECGVPATFFVTTERLDDSCYEYWWDRLARTVPESGARHQAIIHARYDERDRLLEALEASTGNGTGAVSSGRRINAEELRILSSRPGHSIGVHTERHLLLPAQPVAVQHEEIETSTATLERILGRRPTAFAYPFGRETPDAVEILKTVGFRIAVTTEDAPVDGQTDPMRVPRFEVTRDRASAFEPWLESLFNGR